VCVNSWVSLPQVPTRSKKYRQISPNSELIAGSTPESVENETGWQGLVLPTGESLLRSLKGPGRKSENLKWGKWDVFEHRRCEHFAVASASASGKSAAPPNRLVSGPPSFRCVTPGPSAATMPAPSWPCESKGWFDWPITLSRVQVGVTHSARDGAILTPLYSA
jgi:hypothetical protein